VKILISVNGKMIRKSEVKKIQGCRSIVTFLS
jgi:hypothetical protein